mmetsp:Transcript_17959/g.55792  ORF Transcript_17959/g.55792 Transcript_17959/m.55792 type:complete len:423 (-) Transcript_17959:1204-2472(-)
MSMRGRSWRPYRAACASWREDGLSGEDSTATNLSERMAYVVVTKKGADVRLSGGRSEPGAHLSPSVVCQLARESRRLRGDNHVFAIRDCKSDELIAPPEKSTRGKSTSSAATQIARAGLARRRDSATAWHKRKSLFTATKSNVRRFSKHRTNHGGAHASLSVDNGFDGMEPGASLGVAKTCAPSPRAAVLRRRRGREEARHGRRRLRQMRLHLLRQVRRRQAQVSARRDHRRRPAHVHAHHRRRRERRGGFHREVAAVAAAPSGAAGGHGAGGPAAHVGRVRRRHRQRLRGRLRAVVAVVAVALLLVVVAVVQRCGAEGDGAGRGLRPASVVAPRARRHALRLRPRRDDARRGDRRRGAVLVRHDGSDIGGGHEHAPVEGLDEGQLERRELDRLAAAGEGERLHRRAAVEVALAHDDGGGDE